MIGLDTNVLVRYITQDDPSQTNAASRVKDSLSSELPGFISLVVLAELVWILAVTYRYKKAAIEQTIDLLLRSKEVVVERNEIVRQALRLFHDGSVDFADFLIERCAFSTGCEYTITFDQRAAKVAGMRLLRKERPYGVAPKNSSTTRISVVFL